MSVAALKASTVLRVPIKGTLTDADVKNLVVRAARARSMTDVHSIIKLFAMNRLTLVQVIEALREEVTKAKTTVSSKSSFDMALYQQLSLMRDELESTKGELEHVLVENSELSEKLTKAETMQDVAQRLAERVQRELAIAERERDRLTRQNSSLSAELQHKTEALRQFSEDLADVRDRLAKTEASLANAIEMGREAIAERNALREKLFSTESDLTQLRRDYVVKVRLAQDLQATVKKNVFQRADDEKLIQKMSARMARLEFALEDKNSAAPDATAQAVSSAANVVQFSSRAELDKLREQINTRDNTIATKDRALEQLTAANGSLKSRLGEMETRMHKVEADQRAQAVANEAVAKSLLEQLPEDQREIYSSPSYDASSLMLISAAIKHHNAQLVATQMYSQDGLQQSS